MENKKKVILAVLIGIMLMGTMVFVSGCGAKPASSDNVADGENIAAEYVDLAKSKLENASDFTSVFYGEAKMGQETARTVFNAEVKMIRQPLLVSIAMMDSYGTNEVKSQLYLEKVRNMVNMYTMYDGQWTEMTLDETNAVKSVGIYDAPTNMALLLTAGENWEQTSSKDGVITITGKLPAQKVYDVAEAGVFLQLAGMNGVGQSNYEGVESVLFEVQIKEDGTPVGFSIDFTKTLETVMQNVLNELGQEVEEQVYVEKYFMSHEFTLFDELEEIEIPDEAKSAINYEKEISLIQDNNESE
ncbi:MAG: hypothetical protein ACK5I7_06780 [Anaerotignum sp.]